ncbi:hypothetical protein BCD48_20350 [Pseudofrankia sp. BMG5.36]|nr:hypothetical protein BCD48_20350 [Pseudofrankia sp. BMG5.36]
MEFRLCWCAREYVRSVAPCQGRPPRLDIGSEQAHEMAAALLNAANILQELGRTTSRSDLVKAVRRVEEHSQVLSDDLRRKTIVRADLRAEEPKWRPVHTARRRDLPAQRTGSRRSASATTAVPVSLGDQESNRYG